MSDDKVDKVDKVDPIPSKPRPIIAGSSTINLSEAETEEEFLLYAAFNLTKFPHLRYRQWLDSQKPGVQKAARQCPPTKVYRLRDDERLCAIAGYKDDGAGYGRIVVIVFGEASPQFVDPSQLFDASEELSRVKGNV